MNIPKIIDNNRKILLDVIKQIAPDYDEISIATGYWDLPGTHLIIEELKKFKKIRLLIGREPLIPRHKALRPEPDYPDIDIYSDLEMLPLKKEYKDVIVDLKELISKGVLEVKVYKKTFFHAKCYIFGSYSSDQAIGIIGSSNFTRNGLTSNTELNELESEHRIVAFKPTTKEQDVGHLYWYDQFWNDKDSVLWNGKFTELLGESPVGDVLFSPYETYIKTLYELYKDELDDIELGESKNNQYELFEFQKRNVQHLLKKLDKYGTAMLADSVGLGKTITATEVIRYYTDSKEGRKRVVVVCPKSLKQQWRKELTKSGILNLDPLVLQNMKAIEDGKSLDNIASVSLFVIDESHNLRKTTGKRYDALLGWIRNNKNAHILLLTATPINNELQDLSNQILLGTRGYGDSIKITTIDSSTGLSSTKDFVKAIKDLQSKIKKQIFRDESVDYDELKRVMGPIIRSIVVRRTRQGIEREYGQLIINGKKRKFPEAYPKNHRYGLPSELAKNILSVKSKSIDLHSIYLKDPEEITEKCNLLKHPLDQLDALDISHSEKDIKKESPIYFVFQLILMLGFIPYRWRIYLSQYYGKSPDEIKAMQLPGDKSRELQQQRGIYGIFRTMFLKRMESSSHAIIVSLQNYKNKLTLFEEGLKKNVIVAMKDIEALREALESENEELLADDYDDEDSEGKAIVLDKVDKDKYNLDALKEDIKREHELINVLQKLLKYFEDDDSKLKALAALLKKLDKERLSGKKVLIFSYFTDTINYIEENIEKLSDGLINKNNTGFVSSRTRNISDTLASRLSPKSKLYELKEDETELRYLFSSDILSEGQNLQDCGVIINYDLHWNPVRMIQRNGRINRLGSEYEKVFVYNMSPVKKLEFYLRLVNRLEGKIKMINNTIGNDQSVLGEVANPIEFIENLKDLYGEDAEKSKRAMDEAEKSGDFLLIEDDFIIDLKLFDRNDKYSREYKKKVYNISKGKWALLPEGEKGTSVPEIMALSTLYSNKERLVPEFIKMDRTGSKRSVVTTLQALQYLKTNSEDNKRQKDIISCDKNAIRAIADSPQSYIILDDDVQAPTGQNLNVLRIMSEIHYSPDIIDSVRKAFSTKNYLYQKEIRKCVRSIVKAKKEDKPYQSYIKGLIKIARELNSDKEDTIKPNKVENNLIYVNKND